MQFLFLIKNYDINPSQFGQVDIFFYENWVFKNSKKKMKTMMNLAYVAKLTWTTHFNHVCTDESLSYSRLYHQYTWYGKVFTSLYNVLLRNFSFYQLSVKINDCLFFSFFMLISDKIAARYFFSSCQISLSFDLYFHGVSPHLNAYFLIKSNLKMDDSSVSDMLRQCPG